MVRNCSFMHFHIRMVLLKAWRHSMHVGMEAWAKLEHLYGRKMSRFECRNTYKDSVGNYKSDDMNSRSARKSTDCKNGH